MREEADTIGGVILCGGKSRRMNHAKAMLPFGPELMLQRVVRLLSEVVSPIVVVRAADQELPPLPDHVRLAVDRRPDRGPLEGLPAGLSMLKDDVSAAYCTGCDVPLLRREFVEAMIAALGSHDAAVPVEEGRPHPLAGVYRIGVVGAIQLLLERNQLKLSSLLDVLSVNRIPVERLREVDPELHSLLNLNHPEEYLRALQIAGFAPSSEVLERLRPSE